MKEQHTDNMSINEFYEIIGHLYTQIWVSQNTISSLAQKLQEKEAEVNHISKLLNNKNLGVENEQ